MNETELNILSSQVVWRPIVAFLLISGFFALLTAVSAAELSEGCEDRTPRLDSDVGTANTVLFLRIAAAVLAGRFAWILFAVLTDPLYQIGHAEACVWLAWGGFGFPLWTWYEKERWLR